MSLAPPVQTIVSFANHARMIRAPPARRGVMRNAGPSCSSSDLDPTSPAPAADAATASPPLADPQESYKTQTEGATR